MCEGCNNLYTPDHHGFTKGCSCLTHLLETFESWTEDLDQGNSVDVIFLDFQNTFDKVPKKRLLQKLSAYGIRGKVLELIADFLSDRKMQIMVRGAYSEWFHIISWVVQGSVLGPIPFLIYVNDIPETVNSNVIFFADFAFSKESICTCFRNNPKRTYPCGCDTIDCCSPAGQYTSV